MTEEPLSDEALRRVLGKPSREVEQCPVCSMLKYGAAVRKGDEVIANSLSGPAVGGRAAQGEAPAR